MANGGNEIAFAWTVDGAIGNDYNYYGGNPAAFDNALADYFGNDETGNDDPGWTALFPNDETAGAPLGVKIR